jgi:hypothetical protein
MTNPVTDVFRRAAEQHLASLATPEDHLRFLEAARGLLAVDPDLKKRLGSRARSRLVNGPIETALAQRTLLSELRRSVASTLKDLDEVGDDDRSATVVALRGLMTWITVKGLMPGPHDLAALQTATGLLWRLKGEIETLNQRITGGTRTRAHDPREGWVRSKAKAWREGHPSNRPADGYRSLYRIAKKEQITPLWTDTNALRGWMSRRGIKI